MFLFALTRALHFASSLLLLGTFAFDRLLLEPLALKHAPAALWLPIRRRLLLIALPIALLTGALWFLFVTAAISDAPLTPTTIFPILHDVWDQTTFGTTWKIRLAFWILITLSAMATFPRVLPKALRTFFCWTALVTSAAFVASLTWAGHGIHGPIGHRIADLLHLLAAGFWPAGLLPLLLVLSATRPLLDASAFRRALALRFSTMSLIAVGTLAFTGLINALVLVGSPAALFTSPYGWCLFIKLLLFALMIFLGARNLLHWSARLARAFPAPPGSPAAPITPESAARHLQTNVSVELLLATLILLLVGLLGLLPHN